MPVRLTLSTFPKKDRVWLKSMKVCSVEIVSTASISMHACECDSISQQYSYQDEVECFSVAEEYEGKYTITTYSSA
jgi:hypothetical protein